MNSPLDAPDADGGMRRSAALRAHRLSLTTARLFSPCPLDLWDFATTAELEPLEALPGQERARSALELGLGIEDNAYNIFAMGPAGLGKQALILERLEPEAAKGPVPDDWAYVSRFDDPLRPEAIRLTAGKGHEFKRDIEEVTRALRTAIPAAFEGGEFRQRKEKIESELRARRDAIFGEVQKAAEKKGLTILQSPNGIAIVPMRHGQPIEPQAFETWSDTEKASTRAAIGEIERLMIAAMQDQPRLEMEARTAIRSIALEVTRTAVSQILIGLKAKYRAHDRLAAYLDSLEEDAVKNANAFLEIHAESAKAGLSDELIELPAFFRRYEVNLIVDHARSTGRPVVFEDNPTFQNLFGAAEYRSEFGNLLTDFTLIRPGALHRANGGYLLIPALKLLQQPYAYEGLKRTLKARQLRLESLAASMSLVTTASLAPEPIPLRAKIILLGDREIYYALAANDPEFEQLFKVAADFDEIIPRTAETLMLYARLIATEAARLKVRPLDPTGVARLIEEASRAAEAGDEIYVHIADLSDLLTETEFVAARAHDPIISAHHVEAALHAQEQRLDRIRDRSLDQIRDKTIMIATEGAVIGQINGLAVLQVGRFRYGRPSRITATARPGTGQIIDIEREATLAGPLHAKGVLILQRYLASRFAADRPLSLSASLVFEQSYGRIDGDSASAAELFALLSAIAGLPLSQSFAVTGSVNQFGQVQAIGGVNEKIEGFFDVCALSKLTGEQGVIIPKANVRHLMLNYRVRCAVADGDFHVFAIGTIDEGIELLCGLPAGEKGEDGKYPPGSFNARVEERLDAFAEILKSYGAGPRPSNNVKA